MATSLSADGGFRHSGRGGRGVEPTVGRPGNSLGRGIPSFGLRGRRRIQAKIAGPDRVLDEGGVELADKEPPIAEPAEPAEALCESVSLVLERCDPVDHELELPIVIAELLPEFVQLAFSHGVNLPQFIQRSLGLSQCFGCLFPGRPVGGSNAVDSTKASDQSSVLEPGRGRLGLGQQHGGLGGQGVAGVPVVLCSLDRLLYEPEVDGPVLAFGDSAQLPHRDEPFVVGLHCLRDRTALSMSSE